MSDQASLIGFDAPAKPTDRLFFALMPDAAAAEQAEQLARAVGEEQGAKPRRGAREKFHITLFHVGDFLGLPEHSLATARAIADGLRAAPIDIRLDRLISFTGSPRRLPYVLLCGEPPPLMAFQADMSLRMRRQGLTQGIEHRRYTPHLTLLYGSRPLTERAIAPPIAWTAREFVLIRSLIGQGDYTVLGRWPLEPLELLDKAAG